MRVLVSVFDKQGLLPFCKGLVTLGHEIVSTGGTAGLLMENGIKVTPIEKVTGNPETFGGRMKTISFEIESGILFRRANGQDVLEAKALGIVPIDMVVCNLYPFLQTPQIEMIDIGGPTMIRAAAKNHEDVTVVTSPSDYENILHELETEKRTSLETRRRLAIKAFEMTASYDLAIVMELSKKMHLRQLRYGENPHQKAMLSIFKNTDAKTTLALAPVLQGKEISYNNYLDSDQAYKCVSELKILFPQKYSVVIVKHGTPCGVATTPPGQSLMTALKEAWNCDKTSAFGGVMAFSDSLTADCVQEISDFFQNRFIEVIIAPHFAPEILKFFSTKKNVRLIELPLKMRNEFSVRSINGGLLIQDEDELIAEASEGKDDLMCFGETVIKYLKSNALALVEHRNNTLSILASGVGQPNRVECLTKLIAPKIQGKDISKALLVSDAFIPFRDLIDEAAALGVRRILQPGGSIRDAEVIAAAAEHEIAMLFTGRRHFRH